MSHGSLTAACIKQEGQPFLTLKSQLCMVSELLGQAQGTSSLESFRAWGGDSLLLTLFRVLLQALGEEEAGGIERCTGSRQ